MQLLTSCPGLGGPKPHSLLQHMEFRWCTQHGIARIQLCCLLPTCNKLSANAKKKNNLVPLLCCPALIFSTQLSLLNLECLPNFLLPSASILADQRNTLVHTHPAEDAKQPPGTRHQHMEIEGKRVVVNASLAILALVQSLPTGSPAMSQAERTDQKQRNLFDLGQPGELRAHRQPGGPYVCRWKDHRSHPTLQTWDWGSQGRRRATRELHGPPTWLGPSHSSWYFLSP
mmetsp:Transcript_6303/g.11778  ORF Transcript_6303/g.11778 Transcript_6303/m.11778 type:complete len:229 (-) Transcript_6303:519-1205(-)